ncbi:alpha/beta hydrolase family protein [Limnohabitans sp.]|uniref:alpha/beta hydrolase family protein n=1 Tax=Limnohabitans sp. TaxID=1907725 RepID=UPI0035B1C93D
MKLPSLLSLAWAALSLSVQAQTGLREIHSHAMPIRVLYPTAEANKSLHSGGIAFEAAPDAAPRPGTRRLVVLSHGSGGNPVVDHTLATTLVGAGFVVAQPLHRGDNFRDFSQAGPASWQTRPQEVSETIDTLSRDDTFGPLLRSDRVGVHGMSAGGVSGLALAGAQWRMQGVIEHCNQYLETDIGFCLNGLAQQPLQQRLRRAQFALARNTPHALLPSAMSALHGGRWPAPDPRPDPRVAAVSLLVPVGAVFTPESLARIRIPVGLTEAQGDVVLVPQFHSGHVLRHCSACSVLSSHAEAGHFDWLWPWPADVARNVAAAQMRGGLPNPAFTSAQRQSAFERIASFFAQQLNTP